MKNLPKLLAFGAALACSTLAARADQLIISGNDTFTNATITTSGPYTIAGSGPLFSGLTGSVAAFVPVAIIYTTPAYPAFQVFSVSNGLQTLNFFSTGGTYSLTPYQVSGSTPATDLSLVVNVHGYFTGNYFAGQLPGSLSISTAGEPSPTGSTTALVGFSATAATAAPEPGSLLLLSTGLLGTAGFARRFRSKAVTK